ncbi:DNA-formamidopyrimidine glycosylase family protein [Flavobacterium sp. GT3R68]|uniref:DNA-formamidopyrimidine glycosylase family protein n=1 Tax=Flavobacterium sp. GT3R68 TaxID=2594437 RepID=UPI000F8708F4|nr:DNA-formamidopyrimidine glycosylase family protein [Flavobacterium sp. GT3R68]RTY93704.1 endonuclease [Flavobacterium sp. GSN2]TRW91574.1 endonuclease [Flavobacterium sp. GT3R68]
MPEGPSIVILKEEVQQFTGQKILSVSGNSKIDQKRLEKQTVIAFKSWGKHFLICFEGFTLKIHFLLFGTYRVNEKRDKPVRLNLTFKNGEINFYSCSIKFLDEDLATLYEWSADVMNENWNPKCAKEKLKKTPEKLVCDALLEQDIFSGVGNIIKNEVLYRIFVHPESKVGKLPAAKIKELIEQAHIYSFDFLKWKKNYELKKHWLAHTKKECLRCNLPIIKKHTGVKKRRSFFCVNCQLLYQ